MTQSFTDWLQESRLTIVAVDPEHHRLRVRGTSCSDLSCHDRTVVITEDGVEAPLAALNPGDVVRIDDAGHGIATIVVLRRVWEQIASPEL
jgi:hypothetical protein